MPPLDILFRQVPEGMEFLRSCSPSWVRSW